MTSPRWVSLVACAALGLGAAGARADDRALERGDTGVLSAWHGLAGFSSCVDTQSAHRCRLEYVLDGRAATARVAAQPAYHDFDLDAGIDAAGHRVLVYSRCAGRFTEPETHPNARAGCHLFSYRPGDPSERAIHVPVPRGQSAYMPAIDGRTIAYFTSRSTDHPGKHATAPILNVWDGTRVRRIAIGPRGIANVGPSDVDLLHGRVLVRWAFEPADGFESCLGEPQDDTYGDKLWLIDIRSATKRLIARDPCGPSGGLGAIQASALLSDGSILAGGQPDTLTQDTPERIVRYRANGAIIASRTVQHGPIVGVGEYSTSRYVYGAGALNAEPGGIFLAHAADWAR